jgi:biotin operon repressor
MIRTIPAQSEWRIYRGSRSGSDMVVLDRPSDSSRQTAQQKRLVRNAVLSHIKALRALGNVRTNTSDIAEALGVPRVLVEQAVAQLRDEGVKVIR